MRQLKCGLRVTAVTLVSITIIHYYIYHIFAQTGEESIPVVLKGITLESQSGIGVIIHTNKVETGLINDKGEQLTARRFSRINQQEAWGGRMACINVNGGKKIGWIDGSGKFLIDPEWDGADSFCDEGFAQVELGGLYGWIDKHGRIVSKVDGGRKYKIDTYGLIPHKNSANKWGWVDQEGATIIIHKWDWVWDFNKFGLGMVRSGAYYGWIDRTGRIAIPTEWTKVAQFDKAGMALVCKEHKWGWIWEDGSWAIPPGNWDWAGPFGAVGLAEVRRNEAIGWINRSGEIVIPFQYSDFSSSNASELELCFSGRTVKIRSAFGYFNMASVKSSNTGKWGAIKGNGDLAVQFIWDHLKEFEIDGNAIAGLDGKYGIVNSTGEVIAPPVWDEIRALKLGLRAVKHNDKWGWINSKGQLTIEPQWKYVSDFDQNGIAVVKRNDGAGFGLINQSGTCLFESGKGGIIIPALGASAYYFAVDHVSPDWISLLWLQFRGWIYGEDIDGTPSTQRYRMVDSSGKVIWHNAKIDRIYFYIGIVILCVLVIFVCKEKRSS